RAVGFKRPAAPSCQPAGTTESAHDCDRFKPRATAKNTAGDRSAQPRRPRPGSRRATGATVAGAAACRARAVVSRRGRVVADQPAVVATGLLQPGPGGATDPP